MFAKSLLYGLMATASMAQAKFMCGAPEPDAATLAFAEEFAIQEAATRRTGNLTALRMPFSVDTYVHIVARGTSVSDGYLSDATVRAQMDVINADFAPAGITFNLLGTTRTINSQWASDGNEMAMKRSLRRGDYSTLNLYFLYSLGGNLGYCYFPTTATPGSTAYIRDGCSILSSSVPGGSSVGFNLGRTATHEIGHWMNLFHTFQGGCSGSGDSVSDTPAQSSPSSGCPVGRDSCAGGGLDPIHNYMDYSDDACYEEFTPGQITRMNSAWSAFRG
ncbi:hypothetical protein S40285_03811 [Stachybotrys chlorohalonatus IBT 40285]|uniref:Peptidase M43 pregnancy-associated plasma-A domain-containing protein n=1 Tax=Stachybotrys chlorohalonatus (strain IBT 40285) TaxID=1283841 RepID=A0A084QFV2_STAC4|nr:hypothetical protein S40285_03811 [Stachybotrys chlorohalonata IBT 40285]